MKSQVLHTVWCNISGEAAGEIWYWSLLGMKGLMLFLVSLPTSLGAKAQQSLCVDTLVVCEYLRKKFLPPNIVFQRRLGKPHYSFEPERGHPVPFSDKSRPSGRSGSCDWLRIRGCVTLWYALGNRGLVTCKCLVSLQILQWWLVFTSDIKARLHMRFFMRFRCDFGAILRTKPAPAYPARVLVVTLRRNTVKLAEIGKKGVFK